MPRRGSNIYKRKDGRFEGRVAIGHKENGALRYKYVYAHTLSELKNKMLRFQITVQKQPISSFCSIKHGHCCMIFVVIFYIVLQITMVFFKRM